SIHRESGGGAIRLQERPALVLRAYHDRATRPAAGRVAPRAAVDVGQPGGRRGVRAVEEHDDVAGTERPGAVEHLLEASPGAVRCRTGLRVVAVRREVVRRATGEGARADKHQGERDQGAGAGHDLGGTTKRAARPSSNTKAPVERVVNADPATDGRGHS